MPALRRIPAMSVFIPTQLLTSPLFLNAQIQTNIAPIHPFRIPIVLMTILSLTILEITAPAALTVQAKFVRIISVLEPVIQKAAMLFMDAILDFSVIRLVRYASHRESLVKAAHWIGTVLTLLYARLAPA